MKRDAPKRNLSENLKGWLQLMRVPNLFTVPGDPLAGFCLASVAGNSVVSFSSIHLCVVLLISFLCYCAGLLQNDYFDLEEDRKDRPFRPLPSNRVNASAAIIVAIMLFALSIATAFFVGSATGITITVLILIITIFNHSGKRIPLLGPHLMGLCRGLNFLLGASVLGWGGIIMPVVMISAGFLTVYIATVTHIAVGETESYKSGPIRWGPGITLVVGFSVIYFLIKSPADFALAISIVLSILACIWAFYCGSLLVTNVSPAVVQKTIGRFLRGLILIQAVFIALAGYPAFIVVAILLIAWPISQKLANYFYAS